MSRRSDDEEVLVVPASCVAEVGIVPGFTRAGSRKQIEILCKYADKFMARRDCEGDPTYLQLIPYCIVRDMQGSVFAYRRPRDDGEARLASRWSIGVGGHVNEADCRGKSGLAGLRLAMLRELHEEVSFLNLTAAARHHWVGFIRDTSDAVGRVHLGVVVVVDAPDALIVHADGCRETETHQMMGHGQLHKNMESFENWSQLAIRGLFDRPESMNARMT